LPNCFHFGHSRGELFGPSWSGSVFHPHHYRLICAAAFPLASLDSTNNIKKTKKQIKKKNTNRKAAIDIHRVKKSFQRKHTAPCCCCTLSFVIISPPSVALSVSLSPSLPLSLLLLLLLSLSLSHTHSPELHSYRLYIITHCSWPALSPTITLVTRV